MPRTTPNIAPAYHAFGDPRRLRGCWVRRIPPSSLKEIALGDNERPYLSCSRWRSAAYPALAAEKSSHASTSKRAPVRSVRSVFVITILPVTRVRQESGASLVAER